MGKTCFICNCKPKYKVTISHTKYRFCDFFDTEHIKSLKEHNLLEIFKRGLKRGIIGGIIWLIIGQFVLFFYIWGASVGLFEGPQLGYLSGIPIFIGITVIISNNKPLQEIKSAESIHPTTPLGTPSNISSLESEKISGFCPKCGLRYETTDNFCVYCGSPVGGSPSSN